MGNVGAAVSADLRKRARDWLDDTGWMVPSIDSLTALLVAVRDEALEEAAVRVEQVRSSSARPRRLCSRGTTHDNALRACNPRAEGEAMTPPPSDAPRSVEASLQLRQVGQS